MSWFSNSDMPLLEKLVTSTKKAIELRKTVVNSFTKTVLEEVVKKLTDYASINITPSIKININDIYKNGIQSKFSEHISHCGYKLQDDFDDNNKKALVADIIKQLTEHGLTVNTVYTGLEFTVTWSLEDIELVEVEE